MAFVAFRLFRVYRAHVAMFILGGLMLFAAQNVWERSKSCSPVFDLLNPSYRCPSTTNHYRTQKDYEPLRQKLITKIDELKAEKNIRKLSVYFRDLKNGPRFGIQEFEAFNGASLLKLPVMMAILHITDANPGFLDQQLLSPTILSDMKNVEKATGTIEPNTFYTVRELLEKMIIHSDNESAFLLAEQINSTNPPLKSNVFLDLGVMDLMSGKIDELSMQSYANLFVILYHGRYLSNAMSQFALELLSKVTFKNALVAGLPDTVMVAHKFGFTFDQKKGSELHDCGIVYYPPTPYVLCVMTNGTNGVDDQAAIAEISRMVYSTIEALHFGLDDV